MVSQKLSYSRSPTTCPPYEVAISKYKSDRAAPLLKVQRPRVSLDWPESIMADSFCMPLIDCGQRPCDSLLVTETCLLLLESCWERSSWSLTVTIATKRSFCFTRCCQIWVCLEWQEPSCYRPGKAVPGTASKAVPRARCPPLGPVLPVEQSLCHVS